MGFFDSSSKSESSATDRRQAATDEGTNIGDSAALAPDAAIASGGKSRALAGNAIFANKGAVVTVERADIGLIEAALSGAFGFAAGARDDSFALVQQAFENADPEPAAAVQQTVDTVGKGALILVGIVAVGLVAWKWK